MPSWRRTFVTIFAFFLVAVLAGSMSVGFAFAHTAETAGTSEEAKMHVDTEVGDGADELAIFLDLDNKTELIIELDSTGNAHWQIHEQFNITNDEDAVAFQTVATAFEAGEGPQLGLETFQTAANAVDETTQREMELSNIDRDAEITGTGEDRIGSLRLNFTWENFANAEDEERISIDADVLTTAEGIWLPGLTADQQLVIRPPTGYGVDDASVAPANGQLRWTGPVDFSQDSLQATFIGDSGTDDDDEIPIQEDTMGIIPVVIVVGVIVIVLAFLAGRRDTLQSKIEELSGGSAATKQSPVDPSAPETERSVDAATGSTNGGDPDDDEVSDIESDEMDLELLSDEERVERLLEANGGRMKQADIVTETDWSNAKVSQLLSAMESDDRIDKLRIGRENLISFPDQDITDIDKND